MVDTAGLAAIIEDTTVEMFELVGGFAYTDAIALGLAAKWRESEAHIPAVVTVADLAWLLDGYARARLAADGP